MGEGCRVSSVRGEGFAEAGRDLRQALFPTPDTRHPTPLLMLVTEPSARLPEIVAGAVAGGVNVVQLRDRDGAPDCLHETATALRFVTQGRALLLINGDPGVAASIGADGLHLPERGLSVREARAMVGPRGLVGRSIHSVESAERAANEGTDYLIAGTIFASGSHPGETPRGLDFLRDVCAAVHPTPVLAIGGVTPERAADCLGAGAAGVAVLSPLMRATDPRAAARRYREEMER